MACCLLFSLYVLCHSKCLCPLCSSFVSWGRRMARESREPGGKASPLVVGPSHLSPLPAPLPLDQQARPHTRSGWLAGEWGPTFRPFVSDHDHERSITPCHSAPNRVAALSSAETFPLVLSHEGLEEVWTSSRAPGVMVGRKPLCALSRAVASALLSLGVMGTAPGNTMTVVLRI